MAAAEGFDRQDFRLDINGLRAWAVMAVVLYHFGVPGITGGFAGVDIFFVISGYLMCGIILAGTNQGDFSVWRFYLARARRIFPALIALCLVALLFGWFFLMPEEYQLLGRHARESLLFTSNLRYFDESGYFDVASREKWLLHTWSLSVEWQFYLVLPLLLAAVVKVFPKRQAVSAVLGVFFVTSLALCVWRTSVSPSEAFYMLQTRGWEMLAGALVFMAGNPLLSKGWRRSFELFGFALILATVFIFDKHDFWPGWRAVLPVLGASLVLLAAREHSLWTANSAAQWLGTRSYSIYLWHWPLVVALAYLERLQNPLWVLGALLLSLVLGHISYVLIEIPTRRRLSKLSTVRAAVVLLLVLALAVIVAQQVRRSGFPERLPEAVARIEAERENHNPRIGECLDPDARCVYGSDPVRAVLIGDSHADAVVTALEASLPDKQGGVLFRGGSGCPIAFGIQGEGKQSACGGLNQDLQREHLDYPADAPIVLVGRTSEYIQGDRPLFYFSAPVRQFSDTFLAQFREHYLDTVCTFAQRRPVYIVRPIPEMSGDVPTLIGRSLLFGHAREINLSINEYQRRHAFTLALQDEAVARCGAVLLDPLPYLCSDGFCRGALNGRPLYRDADHLSEFGNRLLVPMFEPIFRG